MSEWKEYKLGDVLAVRYGKDHKPLGNGQYPVYGSGGIMRYADRYLFDKESILIPRKGSLNNIFYQEGPFWTVDTMFWTEIDKAKVEPKFLFYQLTLVDLENLNVGSAVPSLTVPVINDIDITLPPLDEQKWIAGVLSSLDDKIDLLNRENATLEALAETLFRHYFIENPDSTWKEGKLGDVAKIGIGRTPPRKETKWFSTSSLDVKWISIKDMGEQGVFIFNTAESLTKDAVETFKIPIIPPNTVVLSFKMTVGRIGITTETMLSNEAIAHFLLDDNSPVTKEYLYLYLKSYKFDTLGSTSSIVTSINSAMIKDIEMAIPDKESINIFKAQVMPLFEKIKSNQRQIQTLSSQRDTLLPRLMSGEVKVHGNRM